MLKNYFIIACKVYMRRKLFTIINLLCITLTLAVLLATTAILQATFYPTGVEGKSDRFLQVVQIAQTKKESNLRSPLGYKVIDQYMRKMKTVEKVAAVSGMNSVSIYQGNRVIEVMMRRADAEYWQILDFKVLSGRVPTTADVQQGRFVAVINESTAKKLFNEAPPIGQKINAGGQQFEIIGVVQDVLHINAFSDIWVPVTTFPTSSYKDNFKGEFTALLMGKTSADLPLIKDEMKQVMSQVNKDDPKQWENTYFWADSKLDVFARILLGNAEQEDSGASTLLMSIFFLMMIFMLIPALNLINLNSGRIMERATEIGVRKSFGATNSQLVGQFMMENIILCFFGGLIGIVLAQLILMWISSSGIVPYMHVNLSLVVLCYGFLITLIFGLLSGVIPAWKMSRLNPVLALKGGA